MRPLLPFVLLAPSFVAFAADPEPAAPPAPAPAPAAAAPAPEAPLAPTAAAAPPADAPPALPLPKDPTAGDQQKPKAPNALKNLLFQKDSSDNGLKIAPWILLQTWGTLWDQDVSKQADPATYGDPEIDPGFSLARTRLGLAGESHGVNFALTFGTSAPYDVLSIQETNSIQLVDAYTRYTFAKNPLGPTSVSLGYVALPFGREGQMSSADLVFQDRAVGVHWTTPSREAGFVLGQVWRFNGRESGPSLNLRAGLFNGDANFFADNDPGLRVVGRLEFALGEAYRTFDYDLENAVGVGVSAMHADSLATKRTSLGADALVRVGPFAAWAEGTYVMVSPSDTTLDLPDVFAPTGQLGLSGQVSGFIPVMTGGLELAVRASTYDDALGVQDNGDVTLLHGAANWRYVVPGLDLGATFIHRIEVNGRSIPNDTFRLNAQLRFPAQAVDPQRKGS